MVHSFYRIRGGECESFEAEAEGLRNAGIEVRMLSRRSGELSKVDKILLPFSQLISREARRLFEEVVNEFEPDIVHIQNTFPLFPRNIYRSAFSRGIPIIQSLRNFRFICIGGLLMRDGFPCEDCLTGNVRAGVRHGCYNGSRLQSAAVLAGNMYYDSNEWRTENLLHFVTASEFSRSRFLKAGWESNQISIKPNLISKPDCEVLSFEERFGAIFVGRLSEEKGIRELLRAWTQVRADYSLVIVGSGPLEDEVREAASKNPRISYLGKLPRDKVMQRISEARVLVLPSICYETFGRTLAEAAAVGTPMIASSGGSLEELAVKSGGKAIEVRDAQLLGDTIEFFLNCEKSEWNKLSSNARAYYEKELSARNVVDSMIDIYRRHLAATKKTES